MTGMKYTRPYRPTFGTRVAVLGGLVLSLCVSAPAMAQSAEETSAVLAEIDRQKDSMMDEASALALSARLRDSGDVSGSASVLEAFLIENEEAVAARIEYAVTLCRLDDLQAGRFEGGKVAATGASAAAMAPIVAACGKILTVEELTSGAEVGQ